MSRESFRHAGKAPVFRPCLPEDAGRPLGCRVPPRQVGRFRPPGRVPFGAARKEPKGGLGGQARLNSGQRASLVRRACPLRTPVLRGSKTGAAFYYRRAPADTPSDARRPPAFCRLSLPHFYHAYGRLILVFKPAGLRLSRRTRRSASPFQADTLGRRHQSVRTQEAGGRRWNCRNRGSRTPEREGRKPTEQGGT